MAPSISRRFLVAAASALIAGPGVSREGDPESREHALMAAAERGAAEDVRRLLAEGARHDARDARGRTALLLATIRNHVDVARALIAAGADVNAKDRQHDSPFLYAGAEGRLEILRMTLAGGADLRSTNRYGGTALIPACHHGHVETVRELLNTRIDIDHVNNLGWTALLEAVILGDGSATYVEIVRLLVAARANLNIADRDGVSPLTHARRRGFRAIVQVLEGAGAR
jgi:uncharacterized protein